jgi:hypothetical protein
MRMKQNPDGGRYAAQPDAKGSLGIVPGELIADLPGEALLGSGEPEWVELYRKVAAESTRRRPSSRSKQGTPL